MMKYRMKNGHEIAWDGITVWINGPDGINKARFGRAGVDIHTSAEEQMAMGTQCLDCRSHGPDLKISWQQFVKSVKEFHGVALPDQAQPLWF